MDLGLFSLSVAGRALARQLGPLHGTTNLDISLLLETRGFALAFDIERLALSLEVAGADLDHRLLLDVVAQFPLLLDFLDDARQTFGIEPVGRVEVLQVRLVEVGDRDRLQHEPVLLHHLLGGIADPLDIGRPLLVHLLHGHLGGHGTQSRDELAGEQGIELVGLKRASAERGRGERDRRLIRLDADVEFRIDIHPHPVARDQRILVGARHRHPQHVHVHRRDVVDDRQHKGATVDHDLFAEEAGADERHFFRGTPIEPVHQVDDDRDHDHRHDEPEEESSDQLPGHATFLPQPAPPARLIVLKAFVCSRIATSTGRRSIEDAP